jgi:uncharacterized Zn finger protein
MSPKPESELTCPFCHNISKIMGVGDPLRYQCKTCGSVIQVIHPPMKPVTQHKLLVPKGDDD